MSINSAESLCLVIKTVEINSNLLKKKIYSSYFQRKEKERCEMLSNESIVTISVVVKEWNSVRASSLPSAITYSPVVLLTQTITHTNTSRQTISTAIDARHRFAARNATSCRATHYTHPAASGSIHKWRTTASLSVFFLTISETRDKKKRGSSRASQQFSKLSNIYTIL